jgi:uncharacterized repeat protein (TIGR01451 family)
MKILLVLLAFLMPVSVFAQSGVSLTNEVFVERIKEDAQGKKVAVLEPPAVVTPGDQLVFVLNYTNGAAEPATGFTVTNPIPDAITFVATDGSDALVSVDGGKNWGSLPSLRIRQPDGVERPAVAADVTHVRWSFARAIPAGASGKLSFRGLVK